MSPGLAGGPRPSTVRIGGGAHFIVEADEYAGNFDPYRPVIGALTNADWDHPDVFADRAAVVDAFARWIRAFDVEPGAPVLVANTGDAGFPVIEGVGAGDFRVAWQDDRNGATSWDTWYRRTTNGGGSWSSAVRLSDATSGAPYKNANGYAFPYGDYFDLDVTPSGINVLIWGEGNNYVGPGGTWFTRGA
jgi:hypothetical protein